MITVVPRPVIRVVIPSWVSLSPPTYRARFLYSFSNTFTWNIYFFFLTSLEDLEIYFETLIKCIVLFALWSAWPIWNPQHHPPWTCSYIRADLLCSSMLFCYWMLVFLQYWWSRCRPQDFLHQAGDGVLGSAHLLTESQAVGLNNVSKQFANFWLYFKLNAIVFLWFNVFSSVNNCFKSRISILFTIIMIMIFAKIVQPYFVPSARCPWFPHQHIINTCTSEDG